MMHVLRGVSRIIDQSRMWSILGPNSIIVDSALESQFSLGRVLSSKPGKSTREHRSGPPHELSLTLPLSSIVRHFSESELPVQIPTTLKVYLHTSKHSLSLRLARWVTMKATTQGLTWLFCARPCLVFVFSTVSCENIALDCPVVCCAVRAFDARKTS